RRGEEAIAGEDQRALRPGAAEAQGAGRRPGVRRGRAGARRQAGTLRGATDDGAGAPGRRHESSERRQRVSWQARFTPAAARTRRETSDPGRWWPGAGGGG